MLIARVLFFALSLVMAIILGLNYFTYNSESILSRLLNQATFPSIKTNQEQTKRQIRNLDEFSFFLMDVFQIIGKEANEPVLTPIDTHVAQHLGNQSKNVENLNNSQENQDARLKANFILKIDSENQEAKEVLGMIAYKEANYKEAYNYLKGVQSSDLDVIEAQGVTFIIAGKTKEGTRLLEKVSQIRPISKKTYLRLGFAFLILEEPIAALQWFEHVDEKNEEAAVGRYFAAFEVNSWREALELYGKLTYPYNALDGFQGIAIESLMALGELEDAEEMLRRLLKSPLEPKNSLFTSYFQAFQRKRLDLWNRYFVAALYYKIVKGDNTRALEYFNKIVHPNPYAEIEKAQVLIDMNRIHEGKTLLQSVNEQIQGSENEREFKALLLPLLGSTCVKLGYFAEAWSYYTELFLLNSEEDTHRSELANILMELQRYDLALDQFRLLKQSSNLGYLETIAYIKSLIHTGQFESANRTAFEWLVNNNVPLLYQIQLGRLMVITENEAMIAQVLHNVAEKEKRSLAEDQQLILLWMALGNYQDASSLASLIEEKLRETPEGLMVLVELNLRLSHFDKAFAYADSALKLSPADLKIADFIARYERRPEIIAKSVSLLKEKLKEDPKSITLQLDYAVNLIDLAIESYSIREIQDIGDSPDLKEAKTILEKVTKEDKKFPEAFFLLGKVYYLLGRDHDATQAYQKTLHFDPSYIGVYQHLALIYEDQGKISSALEYIHKALKFDPHDSDLLQQLATLLVKEGDTSGAIDALFKSSRYLPNDPTPLIALAGIYLNNKHPAIAVSYLQEALLLAPEDVGIIKMLLIALHDPIYQSEFQDLDELQKQQNLLFDKLQALDPVEAEAMHNRLENTNSGK